MTDECYLHLWHLWLKVEDAVSKSVEGKVDLSEFNFQVIKFIFFQNLDFRSSNSYLSCRCLRRDFHTSRFSMKIEVASWGLSFTFEMLFGQSSTKMILQQRSNQNQSQTPKSNRNRSGTTGSHSPRIPRCRMLSHFQEEWARRSCTRDKARIIKPCSMEMWGWRYLLASIKWEISL